MRRAFIPVILLGLLSVGLVHAKSKSQWQRLAPGMDLRLLVATKPSPVGDSRITVLRIDPALWELELVGVSQSNEAAGHTAREWCEKYKLTAAINAGMYEPDGKTHVGYLGSPGHVNSPRVNDYQSVAAFDPQDPGRTALFHIFDLDAPGVSFPAILKNYASTTQNLRLIKRPGSNQWNQQQRKWSEAALGEDSKGRVLFIFSRSPFSMHDLNQELLSAGIGVVAAQHLEGGPEAQLYLHVGTVEREMFGSYETGFRENDANSKPWRVPNVIGVRPRPHKRN